ncbi:phosphotransferase family protein [Streptacidiphilus sp. N1-3]|uniref:Phosphotransferase family protein n=1 Tax=Streptacidiphilus alkalitolerans TaxID=3342712 RepID=A0ABV6X387_9ACTN
MRFRVVSTGGFHNDNYRVHLTEQQARPLGLDADTTLLVRVRRRKPELVRRFWPDEAVLLRHLAAVRDDPTDQREIDGPEVLHSSEDGASVHLYVNGAELAQGCPDGEAVPEHYVEQIARFFGRLVRFGEKDLPHLPQGCPDNGDSTGFLRSLVAFAQEELCEGNQKEFGELFGALGVPDDAMAGFGRGLPPLVGRPFALLHTDVHRRNIIVDEHDQLRFVDWELAAFGDPLLDLSTHLRRMRYPAWQEAQVVDAWRRAVGEVSPAHTAGLAHDLPIYLAYERAQSVYPDVIRAALSLGALAEEPALDRAVSRTRAALLAAAGPLGLAEVPDAEGIRGPLLKWHHSRWFERSLERRAR